MVGVKALVDNGIGRVPDEFIRHGLDPIPADTIDLPVVDLAGAAAGTQAWSLAVDTIRKASKEYSAFQLVGHDVPLELMHNAVDLAHKFFSLSEEERDVYYSDEVAKPFRFGSSVSYKGEAGARVKMWYDFLVLLCPPKQEFLPNNISGFGEIITEYTARVDQISRKLLELFSEALGLEFGVLKDALGDVTEIRTMRINYYPPCPEPRLAIGSDVHTDPGVFTFLQQDEVEGLQVYHGGYWKLAKPKPGAFLVNIADQLEILSNGRFKSLKHRVVVNSVKPRVSVASFYYPQGLRYICPLSQLVEKNQAPSYRGNTFPGYIEVFKSSLYTDMTALDKAKISGEEGAAPRNKE